MQTIGERLEDARKRKGISIREAAEATKIRGDYLQKFEGNQFDLDLSAIYIRGFLHNYALFLKLPAERILDDYDALGRGDGRPHAPSREIYGRMDLSIASAEDRAEHAAAAAAEAPARQSSPLSRAHNNLPKSPAIDPALIFKGGIALGGVLVLVLLFWIGKSLLGGSGAAPAAPRAAVAAEPSLTLIALDTVRVSVTQMNGNTRARVLLPETTLERDQKLEVPRPGTVLVEADVGSNLQFDINGRRMAMPPGSNRVMLQQQ
jgi:cytoskeleton protein RodZ